jgi:hypothetical protein
VEAIDEDADTIFRRRRRIGPLQLHVQVLLLYQGDCDLPWGAENGHRQPLGARSAVSSIATSETAE